MTTRLSVHPRAHGEHIERVVTGHTETMLAVANATGGELEAWSFIPTNDVSYINRQRVSNRTLPGFNEAEARVPRKIDYALVG